MSDIRKIPQRYIDAYIKWTFMWLPKEDQDKIIDYMDYLIKRNNN